VDPTVAAALIASVPSTVAAVGALFHARRAEGQAREANNAVNHKGPGEASISVQVAEMHAAMGGVKSDVRGVKADVREVKSDLIDVKADIRELKAR